MNVLIVLAREPEIRGDQILVWFKVIGRTDTAVYVDYFRVPFQWGATLAQKRTAIIQAARDARDHYAAAHGIVFPAVDQIEILGI